MLNEFNLSIKYKIANNIMYFDIDNSNFFFVSDMALQAIYEIYIEVIVCF